METFSYQNPSSLDDCVSYYPPESFQEMSINDTIHEIRSVDSSVKVPLNENKDGSCLSSSNFEDVKEGKAKRRKKFNSNKNDVEEKKLKAGKKNQKKVPEKPPAGYVHVRARRGQATDSHSLAERVRREKISERMKLLQDLVPGCEKVTGKALVLDEIINYVESLQNQVEFLSLKLASMNPLFYDTGLNLDAFKAKSLCSLTSPWPSLQQPTSFNNTGITASSNYPNLDSSVSNFLQQNQNLNAFTQDKGNLSSDVINRREGFTDQSQYNTLCISTEKAVTQAYEL